MTQDKATFFCYSREDSDFVLRLAKDLRDRGVEIWIDQLDIPAGAAWDRAIEKAIRSCRRMLIVLSPHSVASENVMDEVAFALDQGDRVVPVLLAACDVPMRVRRLQHIDFTGEYEPAFEKLVRALASSSEPSSEPSPEPQHASTSDSPPSPGSDGAETMLDAPRPERSDGLASPSPAPAPRPTGRKKLLLVIAALIALATVVGLATKSKDRPRSRKQTSTAGSGMVAVPSLIGVTQDRALEALARQKLKGAIVGKEETCRKPAGTVVSQDPSGMTQAKVGSSIRLVIAQRTRIEVPERAAGVTVLAPGAAHAALGRAGRRSRIEFMLAGDPCSAGTVTVDHPTAGPEAYNLKAGERGERSIVYGAGKITIQFKSLNKDARLVVRTD